MPWARFDDRFPSNRKVRLLSDGAFRLYVSSICWSAENLTDGVVKTAELRLVADVKAARTRAKELVEYGLWEELQGVGWLIHDYHEYNPTAEQVKADREAKTARQQRWRSKHKGDAPDPEPPGNRFDVDASTDASRNASRDGAGDAAPRARVPVPTRPVPVTPSLSSPIDPSRTSPVAAANNEREEPDHRDTAPEDATRTASVAEQTIRVAGVVPAGDEPAFIAWIITNHAPRSSAWWRTVANNGDLPGLADTWRAQQAPAPATPLPPWCGECGDRMPLARTTPHLRQIEDAHGNRRPCPACHPNAHRKAS